LGLTDFSPATPQSDRHSVELFDFSMPDPKGIGSRENCGLDNIDPRDYEGVEK
jgi:hypothetical protein